MPRSAQAGDAGLVPVLGPFDATMIVMGSIIGAGVFRVPGPIAASMGSLGGILAIWAFGGLVAMCGAFVFAELGAMLPRAGGQYVFLREGYGRFVAFLFGWILITTIVSSAIAYVAGVFAEHLQALLRLGWPELAIGAAGRRGISVVLIALLTLLNMRGLRLGATVQNAAMLAKIAGMLLIVFLGLAVLFGAEPSGPALARAEPANDLATWTWAAIGAATMQVVFTYGGWQNVAAVASEIRRPERNLPLGILLGTGAVIVLYLAMNWALVEILGVAGVAASVTPVATAAGAVVSFGEPLVAALVMLSTFAITQVLLMLAPRIYYAMARDGVFFASAGWVHPRWRTPAVAIVFQGLFAILHVFVAGHMDQLLEVTVIADWVFFALCGLALFLLRVRRPDAPRPYRALGYPWLPGVFLVCSTGIVVSNLLSAEAGAVLRAAGLFAAGVPLYAYWRWRTIDHRGRI